MSRRENEEGTLKIPTAAWSGLKKSLQECLQRMVERDFEQAMQLHTAVAELKKGKRNFDLKAELVKEADRHKQVPGRYGMESELVYPFITVGSYQLARWLISEDGKSLLKPKKKDFPFPNSKTLSFDQGPLSIRLDQEAKTLTWSVDEGNHNVEEAHGSELGKQCLRLLKHVTWTRGSGGTFVGNDEYNEEGGRGQEGGGGNYVTERFGPLGEPEPFRMPRRRAGKSTARTMR